MFWLTKMSFFRRGEKIKKICNSQETKIVSFIWSKGKAVNKHVKSSVSFKKKILIAKFSLFSPCWMAEQEEGSVGKPALTQLHPAWPQEQGELSWGPVLCLSATSQLRVPWTPELQS